MLTIATLRLWVQVTLLQIKQIIIIITTPAATPTTTTTKIVEIVAVVVVKVDVVVLVEATTTAIASFDILIKRPRETTMLLYVIIWLCHLN